VKQKCLDLNTKLVVIYLYKVTDSSKSETEDGKDSLLPHCHHFEEHDKIRSAVQCHGSPNTRGYEEISQMMLKMLVILIYS
jgi:hypothetical protein